MATLVHLSADGEDSVSHPIYTRDYTIGRSDRCDIVVDEGWMRVSRNHAKLTWKNDTLHIVDDRSKRGTFVNYLKLERGESRALKDGDQIFLGDLVITYLDLSAHRGPEMPYDRYVKLVTEMSSLDPKTVVERGLELLRNVSGVDRGYLIASGTNPILRDILEPLGADTMALSESAAESLRVSRSTIEEALKTGKKISHYVTDDPDFEPTESMRALRIRQVWVYPIAGPDGRYVGAVYLDSAVRARPFLNKAEQFLDAVVEHISLALKNALLVREVLELNESLESKIKERTRQLEDSRDQLISQDRLATLGRLVAAIAHELNNPVGAIASFAETLDGLAVPMLHLQEDLAATFPDEDDRNTARDFLQRVLVASQGFQWDSARRRQLEEELTSLLRETAVAGADVLARRLARADLDRETIEPILPLLRSNGDALVSLIERVRTIGRSVTAISECASNVSRIVDGLKTYVHLDRSQFEEADIHRGIQATLSVLQSRKPPDVKIETTFSDIPPFFCHPGKLIQVWTNLIVNALDAVGERGEIVIETHDDGDRVRVTVTDSGCGIPPELGERIFDLDVTTRGPRAGLGLGLPICRTIVEQTHGGDITFQSQPGHTVFTVALPKSPPEPEEPS